MIGALRKRLFPPHTRREGTCPVCGGDRFEQRTALGSQLVRDWALTEEEHTLVERQQAHICLGCGANLRSRTLAAALLDWFGHPGTLESYCRHPRRPHPRLLELNEAGTLTPWLSRLRHHTLARYPEVDMQALPYPDASWDVILHSDVLEHIPDPIQALEECRRVLKTRGCLLYTVPLLPQRLTRTRRGLPPSYHGAPDDERPDWLVATEYGADFWLHPLTAGFRDVSLVTLGGPESIAIRCIR